MKNKTTPPPKAMTIYEVNPDSWTITDLMVPRPLEGDTICQLLGTKGFDAFYLQHPHKTGDSLLTTDDVAAPGELYFVLLSHDLRPMQLIPGKALVVGANQRYDLVSPKHTRDEIRRRICWVPEPRVEQMRVLARQLSQAQTPRQVRDILQQVMNLVRIPASQHETN